MPEEGKKPPPRGLALLHLRSKRGWSQKQLAARLELADPKQISRYETGDLTLRRERLDVCAAVVGYPPEAVDALLSVDGWIEPEAAEEPSSPVAVTLKERRLRDRAVLTTAGTMLDELREELSRRQREKKAEADRREAGDLWSLLKSKPRQEWRELIAVFPEFRSWALAERVCEASVRAAAHKPEEALDLADLALFVAKRVPEEQCWRSRLEGYCWAHIGNARRVANDFAGADKAFARAWELWRAGASSDPDLLPEWRIFTLEASVRRAERQFSEALELLDRARAAAGGVNPIAVARILLKKEHVYDQMGEVQSALETLMDAAPFVKTSGEPHLLFALLFKIVNHLCYLERYGEASERLPQVRELAVQQGNELDLIRVVWLEARVAAGQERREDAIAGLEQVHQDFAVRGLPYDAALASLELAMLYLKKGCTGEVRKLSHAMTWIFQTQGIAREALAALTLFRDAAERETVTAELALQVIAKLESAKRSAPLPRSGQKGRT